jgi:hypothetical protein
MVLSPGTVEPITSSLHFDDARLGESLAPILHLGIVRDQFPAGFDEGDGGGTGFSGSALEVQKV